MKFYRSSHERCSIKKLFLKISQSSQENTCARVSFLINLQAEACNFIKKEILAQVLSCEFCKISKNTFFTEHLRTTASNFIYDPKNQSVKFLWLDETWFLLCYFALFLALKVKNEKFLFCGLIRLSFLFILLRLWL